MFQRMTPFFRIAAPALIIAMVIILIASYFISLSLESRMMADIYDGWRGAVYEGLVYREDGSIDLENLLTDAHIDVHCGYGGGFPDSAPSDPDALNRCESAGLSVTLPRFDYMWSTTYGVHSISIWDERGELVRAYPDNQTDFLTTQKPAYQRAVAQTGVYKEVDFPNGFVYQENPGIDILNPEGLPVVYALPLYNASKTETVGSIFLIAEPELMSMFSIAGFLMIPILPTVLIGGAIFAFIFSRGIRRRVKKLQTVTGQWAEGNFEPRLDPLNSDEIGRLSGELNHMADQLSDLIDAQEMLAGVEARKALARDLHDAAKQQLFAATMQLSAADALIERAPTEARQHLKSATDLTKRAQQELSAVINELRPAELREQSLEEALDHLVNRFAEQTGAQVEINQSIPTPLGPKLEHTLFRIIQEGLSNIKKYSQATRVDIDCLADPHHIELTIRDNGVGFNPTQHTTGLGLQSIRERVARAGGQFDIDSAPNQGTSLSIRIALTRPEPTAV